MATYERQSYTGRVRKLVIAIDVGTTFSGVSYSLLDPGIVPQIRPVTQFVGQREPRGDSKVPSIVCYSKGGEVVAVGAETDPETNPVLAEMDDVIRVEWFKLHLRPPHLAPSQEFELQKLRSFPKNKTPVQVFGDMLRYLFRSTKQYIIDSEIWSWNSVERNIYFVLSHPNGWEGKQQSQMRKAAIAADLVDESEALERISFVSEGEASLHFCLIKDPNLFNERDGILVVDCGGGTIDVSAYSQTNGSFKEINSPQCLFQGSIFVTCRAKEYLNQNLRNSKYGSEYEIDAMASAFDKVTKCTFNDPNNPYYVKFGGFNYNDKQFDIRMGSIKIPGKQIVSFFEPSVKDIIQVIDDQRAKSTITIKSVLLVGGFARSNYLHSRLSSHFRVRGLRITRADIRHLNKAVADGAVSYYIDHHVSARASRYSYGTVVVAPFDPADPDHVRRTTTKFMNANGVYYIRGRFSTILRKDTAISEETEFRKSYYSLMTPPEFTVWNTSRTYLKCYRGEAGDPPQWVDLEPNAFHDTCIIQADMMNFKRNMSLQRSSNGKSFYKFEHEVAILFGLTELKAYVIWHENGVEKRGPAFIIYDD